MNQLTDSQFSDVLPQVEEYQPFPMLALIVFVLALFASILALINPVLLSLPMLTAILALCALVILQIRKSTPQAYLFVGTALAISLFSFAFRATYETLKYRHMESTAIAHADTWLGLMKDSRVHDALELTRPRAERKPTGTDLTGIYGTMEKPTGDLKTYVDLQPEKEIRELGDDAKFSVEFVEYDRPHNRHDVFRINYRLHRSESGDEDYLFSIAMLRVRPLTGNPFWEFKQLQPIRPKFPRNARGIGVFGGTQDKDVIE